MGTREKNKMGQEDMVILSHPEGEAPRVAEVGGALARVFIVVARELARPQNDNSTSGPRSERLRP